MASDRKNDAVALEDSLQILVLGIFCLESISGNTIFQNQNNSSLRDYGIIFNFLTYVISYVKLPTVQIK